MCTIGPLAALLAAALAGPALAQRTWIVAPTGGDFTDLQTAINAAAPGDTLLLRGGNHGGVIVDRSLQLVGDQPRPSVAAISCWAGTTVSATALTCSSLRFPACTVALEDVVASDMQLTGTVASFVRCIFDCRNTSTSTTFLSANVRAVFDRCQLYGSRGTALITLQCVPIPGAPALVVGSGSVVEINNSQLSGGDPYFFACLASPGTSGLSVQAGATVRTSHSTVGAGSAGVPSVIGSGTVLHDSTIFGPAFAGGTAAFLPVVTGQGAAPGAVMTATLTSRPLLPGAVVASLGLHRPVAVPEGTAWVDPTAFVVLRIGLLDGSGRMPVSVPVPLTVPRGLVVTFQGVAAPGANAALVASMPTMAHVL